MLIVEDDQVILEAVADYLKGFGYQVFPAQNFEDVLADFVAVEPQLVLLDLKLPRYGGFHWCREIRKISTVPILFITSAADNMTAVTAMSMGADDLIAKPLLKRSHRGSFYDLNCITLSAPPSPRYRFHPGAQGLAPG